MTTYTLTQEHWDKIFDDSTAGDIRRILRSLKPNLQEPAAWSDEDGDVLSASVVSGKGLRKIPLYTHPAPMRKDETLAYQEGHDALLVVKAKLENEIDNLLKNQMSKEDMVKVLQALVDAQNIDDGRDKWDRHGEAITIMQSAGMKSHLHIRHNETSQTTEYRGRYDAQGVITGLDDLIETVRGCAHGRDFASYEWCGILGVAK